MTSARLFRVTGLLAILMLVLAACGGGDESSGDTADAASAPADVATSEMASEPMEDASEMASDMSSEMAASPCDLEPLPPDGDGSLDMMASEPAATAAAANPNLTTLAQAVEAAGLVDTLNSEGPFTIFAPADCAFEAVPQADLDALLADTDALTNVLTYHVVQGEALDAADLVDMDSVTTVQGEDITLAADSGMLTLDDGTASVIEADIQVGNGVVHVIDGVLMPSG